MPLKQKIISEIKSSGPMPVDRYMEICNTHYYNTRDPLGVKGDFTTAPEISQIFGEIIGIWAITAWEKIGKPKNFALIELGPGRGSLMADLLRAVKVMPGFKPRVHLVETSEALREAQKSKLNSHVEVPVVWHSELPNLDIPSIIIANEFFDALPFKQFVAGQERMIICSNDELCFNLPAEDGLTEEKCPSGEKIMEQIAKTAAAGIIIDYGYFQSQKTSSLQAVKSHKTHNPLKTPGDADLTALVDFGKFKAILTKYSHKPCIISTQREFLLAHGADIRAKILHKEADLDRLINPEQMGELFKVLCF